MSINEEIISLEEFKDRTYEEIPVSEKELFGKISDDKTKTNNNTKNNDTENNSDNNTETISNAEKIQNLRKFLIGKLGAQKVAEWGRDGNKSVENLFYELENEESILVLEKDSDGKERLKRKIAVAVFNVKVEVNGIKYQSKEVYKYYLKMQAAYDTRGKSPMSAAEKMNVGEIEDEEEGKSGALKAAIRGVGEELGIDEQDITVTPYPEEFFKDVFINEHDFPGIKTESIGYRFDVIVKPDVLSEKDIKAGHLEIQPGKGKINAHEWQRLFSIKEAKEMLGEVDDINALMEVLRMFNINLEGWGPVDEDDEERIPQKVKDLLKELQEDEVTLSIDKIDKFKGQESKYFDDTEPIAIASYFDLKRKVEAVTCKIYHRDDDGNVFMLKEQAQHFDSGEVMFRDIGSTVATTMGEGEEEPEAIERVLKNKIFHNVIVKEENENEEKREKEEYEGSLKSFLKSKIKKIKRVTDGEGHEDLLQSFPMSEIIKIKDDKLREYKSNRYPGTKSFVSGHVYGVGVGSDFYEKTKKGFASKRDGKTVYYSWVRVAPKSLSDEDDREDYRKLLIKNIMKNYMKTFGGQNKT